MVAAANGDYSLCKKIKGGEMSYTQEDCIFEVIQKQDDPAGCERLEKKSDRYEECIQTFRSPNAITMKDYEIETLQQRVKDSPEDKEAVAELERMLASKAKVFSMLTPEEQGQYIKEKREEIMSQVDDDEVRSAIAKEITAFRSQNPNADINDLIVEIQKSTEKQQTFKSLDEKANAVIDNLKQQMMDVAQGEIEGKLTEMGADWLKENGWDDVKRALQELEWMKEHYDQASEAYNAINERYEQMKAVYDKVQTVYKKIDEFKLLQAQGKITEWQLEVLKWAVLLKEWLTAATSYVPIFGDTVSTITEETFNATIKLAEQRAQRTTALNKCIDDPLNCDTEGISAY